MKIAVLGASGRSGQRITLEALVHHPERFPIAHPRLTVARVDLFDPSTVAEAVTGSDVVVNATGPGRDGSVDGHAFFLNSTNAVIEGVNRAGSKRLIVVGGAGSLEVAPGVQLVDTPEFPAAWRPTARAQRETLGILRASDIDWTFFSPSALIAPGKRTGKYRLGADQLLANDQGESYISAEDYAVALLDETEKPQFIRQRFTAVSLEK